MTRVARSNAPADSETRDRAQLKTTDHEPLLSGLLASVVDLPRKLLDVPSTKTYYFP